MRLRCHPRIPSLRVAAVASAVGLTLASLAAAGPPAAAVGTWSTPVNLGRSDGGPPSLSVNQAGRAAIEFTYTPNSTQIGTIFHATADAGAAWSAATAVPGSTAYDSLSAAVAVGPDGTATSLSVASQIDGLSSAYVENSQSPLGTWSSQGVVASPAPGRAAVQVGTSGAPVVVRPLPGCGLGDLAGVAITGDCVSKWRFVIGASGAGALVWLTKSGTLRAALLNAAGNWGPDVTLATAAVALGLGVDPSGTATAAYTSKTATTGLYQVWVVTAPSGASWGSPVQVSGTGCSSGVDMARAANGTGLVAAGIRNGRACEAAVAVIAPGGTIGPVRFLSGTAGVSSPVAAATAVGTYVVAWTAGGATWASIGGAGGFAPASKLGAGGSLAAAGGGGWATVAWCTASCSATSGPAP